VATHWENELVSVVSGRDWLVAIDVAVPGAALARQLTALGAARARVIAPYRGVGPLGDADAQVGPPPTAGPASDIMTGIRQAERWLDDLPPEARRALDAWDPTGDARVIRSLISEGRPVGGREVWGARPAAWRGLEDKTTVDALWDAVGVTRCPSTVVPLGDRRAVHAAHRALDAGHGTVWSGDNREGWHGGASLVRRVRDADDADRVGAALALACDTARIMPFVEGIPCSIHGFVLPDAVLALRPCEMLVAGDLHDPTRFRYLAVATTWDPAPADREQLREIARQVGAHLRAAYGYRGFFTVDGVMGADGFRPTELNPRYGAGLNAIVPAAAGLPLYLLHLAAIAGAPIDWRPDALQATLLHTADTHRAVSAGLVVARAPEAPVTMGFTADGAPTEDDGPPFTVTWGPGPAGGYLRLVAAPGAVPVGASAAPAVIACFAAADRAWDLGVGPLAPARAVR
jgi:hypothetical protein